MTTQWNALKNRGSIRSHSINAENFTGAPGEAAQVASHLGPGRKGSAWLPIASGETITLAEIEGAGVIRHIWITVPDRTPGGPFVLRDLVLRAYWDGSEQPSVEVPLGDFFCNGFAERALVTSEPIVVAPTGGMNSFFPMPFRSGARLTLSSDHPADIGHIFFQVDYTTGEDFDDWPGYFHAQWRRSNGTTPLGTDHVIVDDVQGRGTYIGTYVALASLQRYWWGEGEVKFYVDDDDQYPSLCSTGLEDYAGGAWAFQDGLHAEPEPNPITFSAPYFGYPFARWNDTTKASEFITPMLPMHGLYRWHLPDPVFFEQRLKVTVQQIGMWEYGLFERSDDVSTTAYWYQDAPATTFPELPSVAERRPR
ncbi:glycoside hydrolase family 172 protein [Agromyces neolithicus]|uniref:DUF2961 domain-containing protein n=1 Tax=Agromyces neolithicus TaxID=269420 RepID=A0ABN2MB59_9MICO